jgi:hypothetical protein
MVRGDGPSDLVLVFLTLAQSRAIFFWEEMR